MVRRKKIVPPKAEKYFGVVKDGSLVCAVCGSQPIVHTKAKYGSVHLDNRIVFWMLKPCSGCINSIVGVMDSDLNNFLEIVNDEEIKLNIKVGKEYGK